MESKSCYGYSLECPCRINFYYKENTDRCLLSKQCYSTWLKSGGQINGKFERYNKWIYMEIVTFYFFFSLFLYCISHIIHEIGHYIPAFIFRLSPSFVYISPSMPICVKHYVTEDKSRDSIITISGIILGLVPIILSLIIFTDFFARIYIIATIIPYFLGCEYDIENLYNNYNKQLTL